MESKYRKIIFTVYKESIFSNTIEKLYQKTIISNISINYIKDYLNFNDGFRLSIVFGDILSFVDFYCINIKPERVIDKISILKSSNQSISINMPEKVLLKSIIEHNTRAKNIPDGIVLYGINRIENGASCFSEMIIYIAANDPILFSLMLSMLYDCAKVIIKKIFKNMHGECIKETTIGIINIKKFYISLGNITNTSWKDWQIINYGKITKTKHINIKVRNINSDEYVIKCNHKMKIISIKQTKKI